MCTGKLNKCTFVANVKYFDDNFFFKLKELKISTIQGERHYKMDRELIKGVLSYTDVS